MLVASERYLKNMKEPVKEMRFKMTETVSSNALEYMSSGAIIDCKLEAGGLFLGTAMKKAVIRLLGTDYDLKNKEFKLSSSIKDVLSSEWDDVTLGVFSVVTQTADFDKGITTIELYDQMYLASNLKYSLSDSDFPIQVKNLALKIATLIGVDLSDMSKLPNSDYSITTNLWSKINGFTIRNVIDEIAKTTGTTARISNDTLSFVDYTAPIMTLKSSNLKTFKSGKRFGEVNSVVLSRMPQNDNVALVDEASKSTNGLTEIKLVNVEIMDDDRATLISPLFKFLVTDRNIVIDEIEAKTEGHGIYEIGDVVSV